MPFDTDAYGLWWLVIINSAIFLFFVYSFFKPRTSRDWRSFGAFSAFVIALFTEMYGFPLTIYVLSGWLQSRFPGIDWHSHDAGHLLEMTLGWEANPHLGPFHILSFVFIGGGFVLIAAAWRVLYEAQGRRALATTGPYNYVRHPQYVGFILLMLGFLLQWPTILTLVMFPILVLMYVKLARSEERDAIAEFGDAYALARSEERDAAAELGDTCGLARSEERDAIADFLARSEERVAIAECGDTYGNYMAEVPAFLPRWTAFFGGETENARREAERN